MVKPSSTPPGKLKILSSFLPEKDIKQFMVNSFLTNICVSSEEGNLSKLDHFWQLFGI
ncbi:MAG: hypothetical protein F6K36_01735 [Symploca sp. SIO3C6]|uniref:Uncharacterized protein n=1 Tax=Symploca sp. SIO1C4 TaxID=2607765 RepID=A0A6B3MZE3_9CYAN|nr:hypothetical protein [Symploca sp. SIO3C6]NER26209.1 hypothetical protein [Symploca sp. SIO1C4]